MEFFQNILRILNYSAQEPTTFGVYHIIWLVAIAVLTAVAAICGKRHSAKTVTWVVFGTAVLVAILEIYKQINYTFGDGSGEPSYAWYAFPWQFCSTPLYIGLLVGIFRKGRIHNALCAYLATYAVFAGAAVMIYPGDVYVEVVGINIQTMICHGSMVVIGAYLLGSGHVQLSLKSVLKAMPVFAICVSLAAIMNEVAHATGLLENHNFNMFYISPYLECTLPVYNLVHNAVPFPLNFIIYVLGFSAAACVIILIAMGIRALYHKTVCRKQAAAAV
jgi:hypothetical protein